MVFKFNIGTKTGKTYKFEAEVETLIDKELNSKIQGKEIRADLEGYEFEISGASDKSGFTMNKNIPGEGLKKVLLTYGKGMHKRPKREGKKEQSTKTPKGLRLRKNMRGRVISDTIIQINLKIIKEGNKSLQDIFEPRTKVEEKVTETQ